MGGWGMVDLSGTKGDTIDVFAVWKVESMHCMYCM